MTLLGDQGEKNESRTISQNAQFQFWHLHIPRKRILIYTICPHKSTYTYICIWKWLYTYNNTINNRTIIMYMKTCQQNKTLITLPKTTHNKSLHKAHTHVCTYVCCWIGIMVVNFLIGAQTNNWPYNWCGKQIEDIDW